MIQRGSEVDQLCSNAFFSCRRLFDDLMRNTSHTNS